MKRYAVIVFVMLMICSLSPVRAEEVLLEANTSVALRVVNKISPMLVSDGGTIDFMVDDDVIAEDKIVIPAGARAVGYVSESLVRARMGKPARLVINLDSVKAVDGKKVYLVGKLSKKGEDKTFQTLMLSAVLPPFSLGFLFLRGDDAVFLPGFRFQARIDRDTYINLPDDKKQRL